MLLLYYTVDLSLIWILNFVVWFICHFWQPNHFWFLDRIRQQLYGGHYSLTCLHFFWIYLCEGLKWVWQSVLIHNQHLINYSLHWLFFLVLFLFLEGLQAHLINLFHFSLQIILFGHLIHHLVQFITHSMIYKDV